MSYSTDLRERVIKFVKDGGTRQEASTRYEVGLRTVFKWLKQPELKKTGPKGPHRIDMDALAAHVAAQPDALLVERAAHFGMSINGVWCAMKRLDLSKKNVAVR
jgi:putative transposase